MGILNWISNRKKDKKITSKDDEITVEKALDFAKTYQELEPFFTLFVHCFKYILDSEEEIRTELKEIQTKTQQDLKEEQLLKELVILRYVYLHLWFFDVKQPKNQTELDDELLLSVVPLKVF